MPATRDRLLALALLVCLSVLTGSCSDPQPATSSPDTEKDRLENASAQADLLSAVRSGDLTRVRSLLEKGAQVNAIVDGRAALHEAAIAGWSEILSLLIAGGAEVDIRDADGRTPLHNAVARQHLQIAELLIQQGADVNAKDNAGKTILEAAKSAEEALADSKVAPGMVVCIDRATTGSLVISTRAYDRAVAGVVSGAAGVSPGMIMAHQGTIADGDYPVALSGRVFCMVDATAAPIEPGDFLTTADRPGYAMKAVDFDRAQGAILGKAMTRLSGGTGLVLVLVTLQ